MNNNPSRPSQQSVQNALMKALIRKMTRTLIDVLDHAPNLNEWKASYFLVKADPQNYISPPADGQLEKILIFSKKYKAIISDIEEATLFLDGNNLMHAIESLDRISKFDS